MTNVRLSHPHRSRISTTQEDFMGYLKNRLLFFASRWLLQRRWGRRAVWLVTMWALRARIRRFVHEIAELYPVLTPATSWI
jgi:hypothetical protein